jgi:hypothetical protein
MPWYVWTSVASIASILIGGYWDISWHMTIGRDSFWTPAHLAIQLGGIIAGSAGAYQIISTTLRRVTGDGVRVWGFRGPLGAFVAVWGAATMVISAPFDNWWHDAYGLDVKILSPPHVVLTLGILAVSVGGVLQIVRALHRSEVDARIDRVLLVVAGLQITLGMTAILEYTFRSNLHRAECYRAIATNVPVMMLAFATVSRQRWACTIMAGTYTAFMIAMLWIFPLFPAEPKLGPVYQHITHMIPLQFPVLIIVPAFAMDVVRTRFAHWPRWRLALVLGPIFVASLVAVEWPFATFSQTEHARNWVFGADYHPYFAHPEWHEVRHVFFEDPDFVIGLWRAVAFAIGGSFVGLVLGDAMKKVRR